MPLCKVKESYARVGFFSLFVRVLCIGQYLKMQNNLKQKKARKREEKSEK